MGHRQCAIWDHRRPIVGPSVARRRQIADGGPSAISWSCHRWPTGGADDGPTMGHRQSAICTQTHMNIVPECSDVVQYLPNVPCIDIFGLRGSNIELTPHHSSNYRGNWPNLTPPIGGLYAEITDL